jgi:trimeric autotransporter adhesin
MELCQIMSIFRKYPLASSAALAIAVAAALSACGGGSSSGDTPASTPSTPVAVTPVSKSVPVKVIDGAIKNALVCLDKNTNGACDEGEPSARTDVGGNATLSVPEADAGKFPMLALVGTDAVDADFGPVTTAFSMTAPADKPAVVSPLTTLVQVRAQSAGVSSTEAEAFLKAQSGLSASLFADYTTAAASDTAAGDATVLARLIVLSSQAQTSSALGAIGQKDASGATITKADIEKTVAGSLIDNLAILGAAAVDPAVRQAGDASAAYKAVVDDLVASKPVTKESVVAKLGIERLAAAEAAAAPTASPPAPSASVRMLVFKDVSNYYGRWFASTAADNIPDANGLVRSYESRVEGVNGLDREWGYGSTYERRGDLHWNGAAWVDCPVGFRNTSTVRDAGGNSTYNYCDGVERGTARQASVDIAGRTLTGVVNDIRAFPGGDSGRNYSEFGPANLALLGSTTFPTGSKLLYVTNNPTSTAPGYDVQASNIVSLISAAVAAGGDARTGSNASPACASILPTTPASSYTSQATTLDALIAANRGTPCLFNPSTDGNGNSGTRNDWWSNSTLSVGTLASYYTSLPAGTANFYTRDANLRVAFTGANAVTYYLCQVRTGGSTRNCGSIGSGNYSISNVGDARVMSFTNPPALAGKLTYSRILVERVGKVYYGFVSKPVSSDQVRLNLPAANALITQLIPEDSGIVPQ